MGISYSSTSTNIKPSTLMPVVGNGKYEVGCADIMLNGNGTDADTGIFARIFYPAKLITENLEYPIWRPRSEYIEGLAEYRQVSPMKMNFFLDWLIGERRVAAGWHQPVYCNGTNNSASTSSPAADDSGVSEKSVDEVDEFTANENPTFPVVVFSHGISGNRLCYSTFCSSLASYGYVVAAIEHRDCSSSWSYYLEVDSETGEKIEKPVKMATFPDGEEEFEARNLQIQQRVSECIRCVKFFEALNLGEAHIAGVKCGGKIVYGEDFDWTQFKDRLDVTKAAIIGHSFGGATAIAASAYSTYFRAIVVLDGWLYPLDEEIYSLNLANSNKSTIFLNASKWQWKENVKRMLRLESFLSEKIIITLKDIVHQTFSDFGYLLPGYFGRRFCLQGDLDPCYTGCAILNMVVTYLKQSFNNERATEALREIVRSYEEFVLEGTDIEVDDEEADKENIPIDEKEEDDINEKQWSNNSDKEKEAGKLSCAEIGNVSLA